MEKLTKITGERFIKNQNDAQLAQLGHINSIINEYNNIFLSMQKFTKVNSEKYIKNTNDAQVAQLGHLNSLIDYLNNVSPTPLTQLSGVSIKVNAFDTTGFDLTTTTYTSFTFDATGTGIGSSVGAVYDLTTLAGQNDLLAAILTIINNVYSTVSSGTLTVVGANLTININASVTIPIPMMTMSITLIDGAGLTIPLPLFFA